MMTLKGKGHYIERIRSTTFTFELETYTFFYDDWEMLMVHLEILENLVKNSVIAFLVG